MGCASLAPVSGPATPKFSPTISVPERLPDEMTPLSDVRVLTRAGLAVLLMAKIPTEQLSIETRLPIVVDVSDHWARKEVLSAVRLGLMTVFANHRFQPDQPVTRGEMAQVLARLVDVRGGVLVRHPVPQGLPADLPGDHLYSPAVVRVLEAGLMELDASGRFSVAAELSGIQGLMYLQEMRKLLKSEPGR
jgi:hypothetical protein